jgi:UDP-N-acetylmuramyl pentapeptide phosphotransferase/UDP-N-acetylglucosamine-1-phosphate transferase
MIIVIYSLFFSLTFNFIIIRTKSRHLHLSGDLNSTSPQKFFIGNTPRVGGLAILLSVFFTNLIFQKAIGKYSIDHVSQSLYNVLALKFQNYPQLLELIATLDINDQHHDGFWKSINQLDQVRNTQYTTICPDWSKLIL